MKEHPPYVLWTDGKYRCVCLPHGLTFEAKVKDMMGESKWAEFWDGGSTRCNDTHILTTMVLEFAEKLGIGPDSPFEEEK